MPVFVGMGASSSGSTATRGRWPDGHQKDDLALLAIEHTQTINTPQGWELLASVECSPGDLGDTTLTVFWRRAQSDNESDVFVPADGNHALTVMAVFRKVPKTLSPFHVQATGIQLVASTVVSLPVPDTTLDNCLIVQIVAHHIDSSTPRFSAWANAALANVIERFDESVPAGNGGGVGIVTGELATAGPGGTTTATLGGAGNQAWLTLALRPDDRADNYAEEQQAIMNRIQDNWSLTDVAYPNTKFDPADEAYIEPRVIRQEAFNADLVPSPNKKIRHPGLLSVNIRVPANSADGYALTLADAFADLFRNVTFEGISFQAPTVRDAGPEGTFSSLVQGAWYRVQVDCPFYRDSFH